jgi:hypothetical protein
MLDPKCAGLLQQPKQRLLCAANAQIGDDMKYAGHVSEHIAETQAIATLCRTASLKKSSV